MDLNENHRTALKEAIELAAVNQANAFEILRFNVDGKKHLAVAARKLFDCLVDRVIDPICFVYLQCAAYLKFGSLRRIPLHIKSDIVAAGREVFVLNGYLNDVAIHDWLASDNQGSYHNEPIVYESKSYVFGMVHA